MNFNMPDLIQSYEFGNQFLFYRSEVIKHLLSNILLRNEKRSGPENSTCIFVYRYLNEENTLDFQFLTKEFLPPIRNRRLSYS
jgi:hypothetical protein